MKKSDAMRKLMEGAKKSPAKAKKKKASKKKKIDADVNKDGKVDEKDVSAVKSIIDKVKKKIVKKED